MKLSIVLLLGICLAVASASNIRGDTPAEQETQEAVNVEKVQHPVQKVQKVQQLVVQKKATIKQGATTQKKQHQQVTKAKHTQQQQK